MAADAAEDYIARAIAMLREWLVIAEPSNDDEAVIDVPAVVIDAAVAALEQAADDRTRMAAELEQARKDSRTEYIASLFSEPVDCECGCLPGQPCDCSVHDCECIGDCPVCDADGMTFAAVDAGTAATRPADATTGTGEGQRTCGAENEPQRAAEGDGEVGR